MVIDERARHELYERLESTLGEEATETLMSYLPPVGWADVATKRDLDQLRREFGQLRREVRSEVAGAETRLRTEMGSLRHELLAEFHRELTRQTRTIIFSVLGTLIGLSGLAFTLSRVL